MGINTVEKVKAEEMNFKSNKQNNYSMKTEEEKDALRLKILEGV